MSCSLYCSSVKLQFVDYTSPEWVITAKLMRTKSVTLVCSQNFEYTCHRSEPTNYKHLIWYLAYCSRYVAGENLIHSYLDVADFGSR